MSQSVTATISALVVDDEQLAREELAFLLKDFPEVEILQSAANGLEAVKLIERLEPDLVFLDVQMPGLDGFGVLKRVLELRLDVPQVVFATAYDRYAVKAFEVNAVDYLLKPFDEARVEQTLEKARSRVPSATGEAATEAKLDALLRLVSEATAPATRGHRVKVVVRAQNRLLLVDQKEICFASIEDGAISVATSTIEGESNCRTLEELLEQLDPETFWRAHRSYVVNIQHIREVVPWFKSSYQLRMDDPKKTEIPVSRNQTKRLRELFNL